MDILERELGRMITCLVQTQRILQADYNESQEVGRMCLEILALISDLQER